MHWTVTKGTIESLTDGSSNGKSPNSGKNSFAIGGFGNEYSSGELVQKIDVSKYNDAIDTGNFSVNFGGYLSHSGSNFPEMKLVFLNQSNQKVESSSTISAKNNSWTLFSNWENIPKSTRTIQIELKGSQNNGGDNDSYFDDLFLKVGSNVSCQDFTSNIPIKEDTKLKVVPNPVTSTGTIILPSENYEDIKLFMTDIKGSQIHCSSKYEKDKIYFEKGNLSQGTYIFWVKEKGAVIGNGKMIIK